MNERDNSIQIECLNTIFHLFVQSEEEVTKIEIFLNNLCTVSSLSIRDVYNWCNRQGIVYDTKFKYRKELSLWKNVQLYIYYYRQKHKYMLRLKTA